MTLLNSLVHSGTAFTVSPTQKRSIQLANQLSLILFLLSLLLTALYNLWYGWVFIGKIIPVAGFLCLVPIVFNRLGLTTASRIWLSLFLSFSVTLVSIISKQKYYNQVHELDYFAFRFLLLAGCALPPILFTFRERTALYTTSVLSFVILMAYDPLHQFFGVPYPDLALNKTSYDFTNIIVLITFCIIVGAIFFLKRISERSEETSYELIRELNQVNEALGDKNIEIEAQSSELQAQSDTLQENQTKLENANQIIEEQKRHLLLQNKDLTQELIEKNKTLTDTNHELIKHNTELSQFSYTVSHNLRGPVASLLGLIQIMDNKDFQSQQDEVKQHLRNSVKKLDSIIRDLSRIIDIRNDIFRIRQRIHLPTELDSIQLMLQKDLESLHTQFVVDFSRAPVLYTVRPMFVSILYNLISNALKYRSLERSPVIEITSDLDEQYFTLTVKDNGLGIDLKRHGNNLFKMYKRFHHQTEGKGLGLYLIKMQAEALNGKIEVKSQLNMFTEFKVYIGIPINIEEQVLLLEPFSKIFYDATLNSTGVVWNGLPSSEQFRNTYMKGLEFMKAYNTPNWITDMSKLGPVSEADEQWLMTDIIPDAMISGLVRIAAVRHNGVFHPEQEPLQQLDMILDRPGITLKYFNTYAEARDWIREENEKAADRKNAPVHG